MPLVQCHTVSKCCSEQGPGTASPHFLLSSQGRVTQPFRTLFKVGLSSLGSEGQMEFPEKTP